MVEGETTHERETIRASSPSPRLTVALAAIALALSAILAAGAGAPAAEAITTSGKNGKPIKVFTHISVLVPGGGPPRVGAILDLDKKLSDRLKRRYERCLEGRTVEFAYSQGSPPSGVFIPEPLGSARSAETFHNDGFDAWRDFRAELPLAGPPQSSGSYSGTYAARALKRKLKIKGKKVVCQPETGKTTLLDVGS